MTEYEIMVYDENTYWLKFGNNDCTIIFNECEVDKTVSGGYRMALIKNRSIIGFVDVSEHDKFKVTIRNW